MKKLLVGFISLLTLLGARAQFSRHIIQLTDKNGTPYSFNNPSAFLSAKAIERRNRYNISLDSTDLPIPPGYLDSIQNAGAVTILNSSKWLNQVLIQTTDALALSKIQGFPFVKSSGPAAARPTMITRPIDKFDVEIVERAQQQTQLQNTTDNYFDYGNSIGQVQIHEGEYLHNQGFRGENMTIAVLDAGFRNYLTIPAFDSVRINNQILGTWDFVLNESSVNEDNAHGMWCFSIISANLPGNMVGTAPKAKFYLFRTEDAATEYPIEEQNWAAAAERADSLGVDMITSSLGYFLFDDASFNHSYSDMNGATTIITRAADFAVKKGMIVTNSAGNEGGSAWKYLIAPSDGDSVFAIGAINVNKQVAGFSSYGPSADGRTKPNVASVGWGTFFVNTNGSVAQGNGTSFSNPNLAGLIACLWQAFPEFKNMEILDAIQKSSDNYSSPDDRVGYGIPNMRLAYETLLKERQLRNASTILGNDWLKAFPVPFTDRIDILLKGQLNGQAQFQLIDASGRRISVKAVITQTNTLQSISFDQLRTLPHGTYFIKYSDKNTNRTLRLVK
jgi:serine protease AprX